MYTSCKILKKTHWNTSSFDFFTTLDLIWPKFGTKDHTHFTFFDWFPMKYVRGYPICTEKGSLWTMPKMKKKFFLVEVTKTDHHMFWLSYESFSIFSDVKCHFQLSWIYTSLIDKNTVVELVSKVPKFNLTSLPHSHTQPRVRPSWFQ